MSGEEKRENDSHSMESVLQNEVTTEGKNKNTVKCDRCPSVILKGDVGTLKESPVSKCPIPQNATAKNIMGCFSE
jgi:hypothetical protein